MRKYIATLAFIIGAMALVADANATDEAFCYGELYEFVADYDTAGAERPVIYDEVVREWRDAPFMSVAKKKLSWKLVAMDVMNDPGRLIRSVYIACSNDNSLTKESN